ncbi:MAG: HAMP domain-containing histidine kinase [Anaerolineae bacterium]|nr:HAMP domain-containing histidine kinase [Anaerolineae bacterium]
MGKTLAPKRFFFSVHPARAILEAWVWGFILLVLLSRLAGTVTASVMGNGWFVLAGTVGMWTVLRTRIPPGDWWKQALWELAVGCALSLGMLAGIVGIAPALNLEAAWQAAYANNFPAVALMLGTGPGYGATRVLVRLWRFWDRLRRHRMLWALTHAHLIVVIIVMGVFALGLALVGPLQEILTYDVEAGGFWSDLASDLLVTFFPAAMVGIFMTAFVLVGVLPPSALLSFLAARKTTRRLEDLAEATTALSEGNYATRVAVSGEDEAAQLQTNFNVMAETLETTLHDLETERDKVAHLLKARRELVAGVSHELRTPLATLRSYLDSIRQNWQAAPPDTLPHDLDVMAQELNRLQRLIDDLFTLSQAEAGGLSLNLALTDVAPSIRRCVDALAPLAWQRERIELLAELPSDLPPAWIDAGRLEQILTNLLRNALRHTPPGGLVIARAWAEAGDAGSVIAIEVCDTGEGIPPEDLPHIWERFYRGEAARAQDHLGAGLGLALVKELTEAMGGTAAVRSTVGEGSCFTVRMPGERMTADT